MRRIAWMAVVIVASCGGGQGAKDAGAKKSGAATSPGEECMARAETRSTAPVDAPERIDIAQILVRHAGVKNSADVTRTADEACLRAEEARKKLLGGGDWDEIRAKYSDEQGAAGGVLYGVTQGDLDPTIAGAAFSLSVDELSNVVETKRGFHVIWRKK